MSNQPAGIAPGIYYDLSAEEYHADPALSSSGIKTLLKSPLKYWHSSPLNPDRKSEDSQAMKMGRAFHTMLLEPEKFREEFSIKPNVQSTSAAGMVGEGDYKDIVNAVKVVREDKTIAPLIAGGNPEVSIFWRDEETGIMCRVRFDYLRPRIGFDYKTTTDVSRESLSYAIADYRYDLSASMYLEGLRQASLMDDNHLGFVLLFQEKKAPYQCEAVRLSDEILSRGHESFRNGLEIYKQHIERYGIEKWSNGCGGVKDFGIEDMPYRYKQ